MTSPAPMGTRTSSPRRPPHWPTAPRPDATTTRTSGPSPPRLGGSSGWKPSSTTDGSRPWSSSCTATTPWPSSNACGGQPDPQAWAQLAAGWERIGFRYDEALARFRHAEALLAGTTGRRAAARRAATDALSPAYATAQELGATPLLTDIDDLARRARLPVGTTGSSTPQRDEDRAMALGLTPREHEVLALLARGRSNGEIAKALFITTKTASVHVSNILRKLDVTNRVEAANLARRP